MKGRCPTCGKAYEIQTLAELPSFPFCSDRCRLVDLGRWIDGAHVIPDPPAPGSPATPNPSGADDEDD
ncbi:MAG: DNA gyrase inhibitor YacG [Isosphaeraceae bacterium]